MIIFHNIVQSSLTRKLQIDCFPAASGTYIDSTRVSIIRRVNKKNKEKSQLAKSIPLRTDAYVNST